MHEVLGAVIAAFVALITAYLTLFLGERYKRFHEGSALAAGFSGELASYAEGYPLMRDLLGTLIRRINQGEREGLGLRPFEKPVDRFFEASVSKIGLLGPELAERLIYVYSNLNAFRVSFALIVEQHQHMSDDELRARVDACQRTAERAAVVMNAVVQRLNDRSKQRFRIFTN